MLGRLAVLTLLAAAAAACQPGSAPKAREAVVTPGGATAVPRAGDGSGTRLYYVPVYSHIYFRDTVSAMNLAVTLSIRNTDPQHGLKLSRVDYYDTRGRPLRAYLASPRRLAPLETAEYVVPRDDTTGGSGANFLVELAADSVVTDPVVEAVMIGFSGSAGTSFVTHGRPLQRP
ncbi:MAG TPA: DUF3124 domain-containing protein [Longimicrobium sp.]|nr:DUF3124 domain-containing protein [Longimicrobium sp.]